MPAFVLIGGPRLRVLGPHATIVMQQHFGTSAAATKSPRTSHDGGIACEAKISARYSSSLNGLSFTNRWMCDTSMRKRVEQCLLKSATTSPGMTPNSKQSPDSVDTSNFMLARAETTKQKEAEQRE